MFSRLRVALKIPLILANQEQIMSSMEELNLAVAQLAGAVEQLANIVVTEISQISEKLSEMENPDLSAPIAQLSELASKVNAISDQVAEIVPDDVTPEPLPEVEIDADFETEV
jgi:hypothetical protein